ncbi:MAG: monovalent cation/H+ antiporter subunit D family protein [Arachnia sp.]
MTSSLLLLFVAVPLLSAGLLVVARFAVLRRILFVGVPALSTLGGALLIAAHQHTPVIAHEVGAYLPGVAIVFVSDSLSALMLFAMGVVTTVSTWFLTETREARYRFVPALTLLLLTGVNGALLTGDLFNLFVFVEVMLLPSYALVAVTGSWRRLGVGRMFVLVNLLASTILVAGVGLMYGATQTVNLAMLAGVAESNPQAGLAGGIIIFAMLVKAGVVPVHGWLPRSYPATSAGMMSLFSGLHTKIGLYVVYRIFSIIYAPETPWLPVLSAVVIATIIVGSLSTFGERRIRGALAFQMVAGVGQILIGLIVFTELSVTAGLFYMVHHMVTMAGLVLASGAIEATYGSGRFDRLHGLMRREPVLAAVMALGLLSLVGLPPTSGLWGKVSLLAGAAQEPGWLSWALIGSVAFASIVSLMALQRVWVRIFWGRPMTEYLPDDPVTARGELTALEDSTKAPLRLVAPSAVMIGLSVALFFTVGLVWPYFEQAAAALLDIGNYVSAVLER